MAIDIIKELEQLKMPHHEDNCRLLYGKPFCSCGAENQNTKIDELIEKCKSNMACDESTNYILVLKGVFEK